MNDNQPDDEDQERFEKRLELMYGQQSEPVIVFDEESALESELIPAHIDWIEGKWEMCLLDRIYINGFVHAIHGAIMFSDYSPDVYEELSFLRDILEALDER